ncbi:MAG: antirestriction protein ArdA [Sideroxyarcus sp.]|nr:antirestriction protein ArdA [Sideroxyarcus sp.]
MDKIDEVCLYEGNLEDATGELFEECHAHAIPENLRFYIDYKAFARDCEMGGDMVEFDYDGTTYTCTNASCS